MPKARWSEWEERLLRLLYPYHDNETIAEVLGKSRASIDNKASRMGLKKAGPRGRVEVEDIINRFDLISREEARNLDEVDVLRLVWSLALMYRRELNNPHLSKAERHKLMNAFSAHLATLNNVMKSVEAPSEVEEDLEKYFVELVVGDKEGAEPRRVYIPIRRVVRLRG